MNESILYTLAEVAVTLAGFSGVVGAFRLRGIHAWSPTELRVLWLLIGDSFLVLLFSLLPIPLVLADWSQDAVWGFCNALLGLWFIVVDLLVLREERRDRAARQLITVPVISPILYVLMVAAAGVGIALLLSAWDLVVPRGQAIYVLGLIVLLAFAALEFMFFIGLMSRQEDAQRVETDTPTTDVDIRPWSDGDLPLLERLMADPAMTEHLGGPETSEKIRGRHQRYLRDSDKDHMFVIVVGPERVAAGSIGYWEKDWRGQKVWETGWSVLPEFQGHGVATTATAAVVQRARADGKHRFIHAFPSVDNAASNAICRKAGFTLQGEADFEYPPGNIMRCNDWRLDLFKDASAAPIPGYG
ncbi:MAG TPA: GNAT family N-acetyltransferase [Anaerolineales bacterium]|nr:GNAT family N-acetyltransferase [Anaerolineales bacterium]